MAVRAASNGDPAYLYGPLAERVVWPFVFGHINVTSNSDQGWMTKYLRNVPNTLPPGSIWQVSAQDQYLVIGTDTSLSHLAVPMINGFSPTP